MTPLEGLMMGTRAGSFDPGIALKLLDERRLRMTELSDALEHESGLVGVSGVRGGMREVEAAAGGNQRAALAFEMFCRRAAEGIAAAATSLPRLDALVFTGGIGENSAGVRERIVGRLVVLEAFPVLVVEAREDLVIADAVGGLIA
jgi:acetate kinase